MDHDGAASTHLVACGHGTRDPRGQETMAALVRTIAQLADGPVHGASVDVQEPAVGDVVEGLPPDSRCLVMPLLLSTGFHTNVDLMRAAERRRTSGGHDKGSGPALVSAPLGPSADLARLQARRLQERGWHRDHPVVMGVVGSSVAAGRTDAQKQADFLSQELGIPVRVGYGAAAKPTVSQAIQEFSSGGERTVYVSSYILAPGVFQDRLERTSARVAGPLLHVSDPESLELVAHLALARAREKLRE
ncbi:sirohydrochlorin chelatase [uncultured Kocuria sp.]|uniref:sirohydrochlorin chelatase n=1 Tax=uncultured Kocuria sp. TaxID=259305 RepID=UPI002597733F|nr:CbiX/SirB N-terminal domain-containing protein [uncultured Kocuria sp.]